MLCKSFPSAGLQKLQENQELPLVLLCSLRGPLPELGPGLVLLPGCAVELPQGSLSLQ